LFIFLLGDKDKEIHNNSNCEPENELMDFDDLPRDDLDGSNDMGEHFVYGDDILFEENIYQINVDLGYSH
jgi:hypothetical protein